MKGSIENGDKLLWHSIAWISLPPSCQIIKGKVDDFLSKWVKRSGRALDYSFCLPSSVDILVTAIGLSNLSADEKEEFSATLKLVMDFICVVVMGKFRKDNKA